MKALEYFVREKKSFDWPAWVRKSEKSEINNWFGFVYLFLFDWFYHELCCFMDWFLVTRCCHFSVTGRPWCARVTSFRAKSHTPIHRMKNLGLFVRGPTKCKAKSNRNGITQLCPSEALNNSPHTSRLHSAELNGGCKNQLTNRAATATQANICLSLH